MPSLGKWVSMQRRNYRKVQNSGNERKLRNKKSRSITSMEERIEKLKNLGFVWDANDANWYAMVEDFRSNLYETVLLTSFSN